MENKGHRKIRTGRVVGNTNDKSITVIVETLKKNPLYGKIMKSRKKFVAHDEKNECGLNDIVRIMESRPLSKTKRWRLMEIVRKAELQ